MDAPTESKTGTYAFRDGKLVKVSNRIPSCTFDDVTCPNEGYQSEQLGCFVRSRRHKRDILKEKCLAEAGDGSAAHTKTPKRPTFEEALNG